MPDRNETSGEDVGAGGEDTAEDASDEVGSPSASGDARAADAVDGTDAAAATAAPFEHERESLERESLERGLSIDVDDHLEPAVSPAAPASPQAAPTPSVVVPASPALAALSTASAEELRMVEQQLQEALEREEEQASALLECQTEMRELQQQLRRIEAAEEEKKAQEEAAEAEKQEHAEDDFHKMCYPESTGVADEKRREEKKVKEAEAAQLALLEKQREDEAAERRARGEPDDDDEGGGGGEEEKEDEKPQGPPEQGSTVYYEGAEWVVQYINSKGMLDLKRADGEQVYGVGADELHTKPAAEADGGAGEMDAKAVEEAVKAAEETHQLQITAVLAERAKEQQEWRGLQRGLEQQLEQQGGSLRDELRASTAQVEALLKASETTGLRFEALKAQLQRAVTKEHAALAMLEDLEKRAVTAEAAAKLAKEERATATLRESQAKEREVVVREEVEEARREALERAEQLAGAFKQLEDVKNEMGEMQQQLEAQQQAVETAAEGGAEGNTDGKGAAAAPEGTAETEYLKHAVLKFAQAADGDARLALLPVISTILHFSPAEAEEATEAIRKASGGGMFGFGSGNKAGAKGAAGVETRTEREKEMATWRTKMEVLVGKFDEATDKLVERTADLTLSQAVAAEATKAEAAARALAAEAVQRSEMLEARERGIQERSEEAEAEVETMKESETSAKARVVELDEALSETRRRMELALESSDSAGGQQLAEMTYELERARAEMERTTVREQAQEVEAHEASDMAVAEQHEHMHRYTSDTSLALCSLLLCSRSFLPAHFFLLLAVFRRLALGRKQIARAQAGERQSATALANGLTNAQMMYLKVLHCAAALSAAPSPPLAEFSISVFCLLSIVFSAQVYGSAGPQEQAGARPCLVDYPPIHPCRALRINGTGGKETSRAETGQEGLFVVAPV
jgi:hypothetical protein